MMKNTFAAILFGLALSTPALAAEHDHNGHAATSGQDMELRWADGIVKKVNADIGKITLSHGPLSNLDMPAMTMVFRVKDPAWLTQYKPGDHVRFVAERLDGALTVTALQPRR